MAILSLSGHWERRLSKYIECVTIWTTLSWLFCFMFLVAISVSFQNDAKYIHLKKKSKLLETHEWLFTNNVSKPFPIFSPLLFSFSLFFFSLFYLAIKWSKHYTMNFGTIVSTNFVVVVSLLSCHWFVLPINAPVQSSRILVGLWSESRKSRKSKKRKKK